MSSSGFLSEGFDSVPAVLRHREGLLGTEVDFDRLALSNPQASQADPHLLLQLQEIDPRNLDGEVIFDTEMLQGSGAFGDIYLGSYKGVRLRFSAFYRLFIKSARGAQEAVCVKVLRSDFSSPEACPQFIRVCPKFIAGSLH